MRRLLILALGLMLAGCATHPGRVNAVRYARDAEPVTARVQAGALRGVEGNGVRAFLGVPFAAPPTGDLRFRAPQPAPPWDGVRDATRIGSDCTQALGRKAILGGGGGIVVGSEDCLYLNVYAPATATGLSPVMVYIPGGAFTIGSGANYDPSRLAREQGRVVVTINYRLGALGWLAHPDFARSGDGVGGEYGLMDQLAALEWVHENIAALGGDPADVTLMAESAGAWSACYLMVSPQADDLFQRVILQSGACLEPTSLVAASSAANDGVRFADGLGCSGEGAAACLRALAPSRLAKAASTRSGLNGPGSWGPVYGGGVAPESPATAFMAGRYRPRPALIGTNLDEGRLFATEVRDMARYNDETIWMYEGEGPRVLERYPVGPEGPAAAIASSFTDSRFACPSHALRRLLSQRAPVHGYEFADRQAPIVVPDWLTGLDMGAYHASELAYVFGTRWVFADPGRFTPQQKALSDRMMRLWAGFGHDATFDGDWPAVGAEGAPIRVFTPDGDRLDDSFFERHQCAFWGGTIWGAVS
jgi:para-nitrobenzyl esterase